MIKSARSLVLLAATALALTACSSNSGSSQKAAESQLGAIKSAVAQAANSSDSASSSDTGGTSSDSGSPSTASGTTSGSSTSGSSSSGSGTDPTTVDVCALLTPADGNSIAQANGLGSFTAAKDDRGIPGSSACMFSFGGTKSVIMEVRAGRFIAEYALDPKVNGLGDEAYDDGTSPAVRVGDLLITAEMNSLSDAVTLDLLRKMVPNVK